MGHDAQCVVEETFAVDVNIKINTISIVYISLGNSLKSDNTVQPIFLLKW